MRWACPECGSTIQARPRYATRPTARAKSWSRRIYATADRMGTPFMPWQRLPARLIAELRADNRPRWPLVITSVPRQSGKTTIAKSSTTARAERTAMLRLYGTAQTRVDAVAHLEELAIALGDSVKARLGVGAERITWPNGSIYRVIAPNETGGHGPSLDWMLLDEAWTVTRRFLGGVRPAMAARPQSQMLAISTMGTLESEGWNGLVAMGREATEDPAATIAYLEYSAPSDDAVFDESQWHHWMPALGRTVNHEHIRSEMAILEPSDFVRGYGNRTTATLTSIFPAEWVENAWSIIAPPDRLVLAVEVNNEPAGATITSAHLTDTGAAVRTVEWRYGSPRWAPGVVDEILQKRTVEAVAVDFGGPAKAIQAEITAVCDGRNVALVDRQPRQLGGDFSRFYDALREGAIALEKSPPLAEAIAGAHRKTVGDLTFISRRQMTVDASPVIAAILAYGTAVELGVSPLVTPFVL